MTNLLNEALAKLESRGVSESAILDKRPVTLQCNECGKKRKVSPDGEFFDRCPSCGGVDWDVL